MQSAETIFLSFHILYRTARSFYQTNHFLSKKIQSKVETSSNSEFTINTGSTSNDNDIGFKSKNFHTKTRYNELLRSEKIFLTSNNLIDINCHQ